MNDAAKAKSQFAVYRILLVNSGLSLSTPYSNCTSRISDPDGFFKTAVPVLRWRVAEAAVSVLHQAAMLWAGDHGGAQSIAIGVLVVGQAENDCVVIGVLESWFSRLSNPARTVNASTTLRQTHPQHRPHKPVV
jgi:hypothetical protein